MPTPPTAAENAPWLVFGGSGAVGRFLLRRLAAGAVPVRAISRQPAPGWAAGWSGIDWQSGDLHGSVHAGAAARVLSAGPLDALCDWLPRSGLCPGARVVALSSMSAIWKQQSPQPAERRLAQWLLECERRLTAAAVALQVELQLLRPTLIYGAGIDRSLTPLLEFARRRGWLPWPASGTGLRQPVHADDVAVAMLAAAEAMVIGDVLALPGGEILPFDRLLERLLGRQQPPARLLRLPVPGPLLHLLAGRDNRVGRLAVPFHRSRFDQLADDSGWRLLGLRAREFDPQPDDFLPW